MGGESPCVTTGNFWSPLVVGCAVVTVAGNGGRWVVVGACNAISRWSFNMLGFVNCIIVLLSDRRYLHQPRRVRLVQSGPGIPRFARSHSNLETAHGG